MMALIMVQEQHLRWQGTWNKMQGPFALLFALLSRRHQKAALTKANPIIIIKEKERSPPLYLLDLMRALAPVLARLIN
jgi:hypothetical protein